MADGEEDYIIRGPPLEYVARYTSAGKLIFDRLQKNPAFVGQLTKKCSPKILYQSYFWIEAHTGHKYTFGEILDRSIRLALWLRDMDIGPGDVVGYATRNHKDVIIVVYATFFVGAVLSPWDPALPSQNIARFMDLTKPKIVICSGDAANSVKSAAEELHSTSVLVVHGESSGFISFEDTQIHTNTKVHHFQCTEVDENHVALLVCTSGTTALPKIMPRSHKSILIAIQNMEKRPYTGSIFMTSVPLCWVSGLHATLMAPSATLQFVTASYSDADSIWKWIAKYQVNFIITDGSTCLRMIHCDSISNYDVSSLQMIVAGGSLFRAWHYEKFLEIAPVGCKLFQIYGTTETGGSVAVKTRANDPGSCGSLVTGISGKIVDPHTGRTISPYETGELCLKHPGMFTSYYNDPARTKSAIDSDGWYHTGDFAKFDKNGELFVIDKLMDMIDINGFKVSHAELEAILTRHPGVENAGVIGKRISSSMEYPVALVVKSPGSIVTEAEICNFVKTQVLDDEKQLRGGVRFIDKMPCSTSGKINEAS